MKGKEIKQHDIIMLNHELLESQLMKQGLDFDTAHEKAQQKYNYSKEIEGLESGKEVLNDKIPFNLKK